ncbi:MAG TPA: HAD family hydrolase [Myxococcaceae bacterium]|nr:HAD family hydrolase [Myxococcaceae bacterium]
MPTILFDIDGTLLDSVDLHARAWREAFLAFGKDIPFEVIRSQIGKGGDQLLPVFFSPAELAARGKEIERWRGDWYKVRYMRQVRPFPGVRSLFVALRERGWTPVLASSAKEEELEFYVRLLEVADLIEGSTSGDDVQRSKPHPDIFAAALERAPSKERPGSWVVGDSPWDALAASRLGLPTMGFRCGGFPEEELRGAGARTIFDGPADLLTRLDQSPFAARG